MRVLALVFSLIIYSRLNAAETIDLAPIGRWIAGQRDVKSLTADFIQTRSLRTLRDPLANPGKLWFRAPDAFRWEIGDPAKNILLRNGDTVFLIQPRQKKATRFRASPHREGSSDLQKQAGVKGLMMMQFPFALSLNDFRQRFTILDLQEKDGAYDLSILPKESQAQKFLKALHLRFETKTGELLFFEMITREGSTLRNDFSNVKINEKITPGVFNYDFSDHQVTDAKE